MNTNELETLGFYQPGFLHLRINAACDISDLNQLAQNKNTQKYFSTFLHEYIHFLQEVTTTSGLMSSIFYIDLIKDVNWTIRNDGKPEFEVPFKITNEYNGITNTRLHELYRGEANVSNHVIYKNYTIGNDLITDKDSNTITPKKYEVYFIDVKTHESKKIHFGNTCLKEYVAHTIQKKFTPTIEHPDVPYQIAEQIVVKECPNFGVDVMNIVALCDACLMCYYPAEMFFNTLERIKSETFVPKDTKDVYEFTLKNVLFRGKPEEETSESLFRKTVGLAEKQFGDALQAEYFSLNYKWLKHILQHAQELRLKHPDFMIKLVESEGKLSILFFEIFKKLGTPFFSNNMEKGGFVPPNELRELPIQPYQLLVFREVINIFNGSSQCSLYKFCKTRPDMDITNKYCKTEPWKRATEPELCPLGQIWRTWGLTDEIPVHK